jgi:putative inorganic carbon (hco3(-)) transporter
MPAMLAQLVGRRRPLKGRLLLGLAVAAICAPFVAATFLAPQSGVTPLLGIGLIAGPIALGTWLACSRPLSTLVALYIGLAPIDFLLVYSSGVTISRLIGFLAIGALVLTIIVRGPRLWLPRSVVAWLVAFVFIGATVIWAGDQPKSIDRLLQTAFPILIMTLAALSRCDRSDIRVMLFAVVAGATAISLYAVVNPPPSTAAAAGALQGRLVLSNGNTHVDPNGLAFSLMAPLAIVLALALSPGNVPRRVVAAPIAILIILAILLTESRGGLLGMGVMLIWFAVRSRNHLIAVGVIACAALASTIKNGAWERLFSNASSNVQGAGRLPVWRVGLEAFRHHWLIGNGYGTFSDAYNQEYLLVPHAFITGWSREAHSLLVSSFVELGIFGGALILFAWWCQFRELRSISQSSEDAWLRLAMEAGVLGVFTTSMFLDILVLKPAWVLPILIAVISSVLFRERSEKGAAERASAATSPVWPATVVPRAAPTR